MKSLLHLNKLILFTIFLSTLIFNNLLAATSIDIWEKKKEDEKKDTATQVDETIKSPILSGDNNKITISIDEKDLQENEGSVIGIFDPEENNFN